MSETNCNYTGMVSYRDLHCKSLKVSVPWNIRRTDKYWVSEGGICFNPTTGEAKTLDFTYYLDITTIRGRYHDSSKIGENERC